MLRNMTKAYWAVWGPTFLNSSQSRAKATDCELIPVLGALWDFSKGDALAPIHPTPYTPNLEPFTFKLVQGLGFRVPKP